MRERYVLYQLDSNRWELRKEGENEVRATMTLSGKGVYEVIFHTLVPSIFRRPVGPGNVGRWISDLFEVNYAPAEVLVEVEGKRMSVTERWPY